MTSVSKAIATNAIWGIIATKGIADSSVYLDSLRTCYAVDEKVLAHLTHYKAYASFSVCAVIPIPVAVDFDFLSDCWRDKVRCGLCHFSFFFELRAKALSLP